MLDLGLSKAEERQFLAALVRSHRIRVTVDLTNTDEVVVDSLTAPQCYVLDGSIQVDAKAEVTRSLDLTLLDPKGKLGLIPDSPAQGALYMNRMVRVRYGVYVDDLTGWVDVPVFFGPVATLSHQGPVIRLTALGKESLMKAPHLAVQGYSIPKDTRLDEAIKRVAKKAGERRFLIPKIKTTLEKSRAVEDRAEPWLVLAGGEQDSNGKAVAGLVELGKADRQIFYDGRGRLCVRRRHRDPVATLRLGKLASWPNVDYDAPAIRNYWGITGVKPKGGKAAVEGHAELPAKHPLSATKLGRNGEKRYMAEFTDTSLETSKECDERAAEQLDAKLKAGVAVELDCLPLPHLQEGDYLKLCVGEYALEFVANQFSIPLGSGLMSIGANKRVQQKRRRIIETRQMVGRAR